MISLTPLSGYARTKHVAGVAVRVGDEILIVQRAHDEAWSPDKWALPAGGLDGDETASMAAAREIQEEVGIVCDTDSLIPIALFYHVPPEAEDTVIHFHVFEYVCEVKPEVHINYELQNYAWIRQQDIGNYDLLDAEDIVLARCFSFDKK